jgi:hypothetical protein
VLVWIVLDERINGYERDDKNLGGEVEYLTMSDPTRVLIAVVTPVHPRNGSR